MGQKKVGKGEKVQTEPKAGPWPTLSPSPIPLELCTLLEDQIVTVPHFFTAKECASLVTHASTKLALSPPRPPGKDEAARTNYRWQGSGPAEMDLLRDVWARLGPVIEPATLEGERRGSRPAGLHSNVRVYRYEPGQLFRPHYDDSLVDPVTGLRSGWTLLVYLSGLEDGVRGGQTAFFHDGPTAKKRSGQEVVAELARGTALLHRHGARCMLHEARPVLEGVKWVLRTDLLFA